MCITVYLQGTRSKCPQSYSNTKSDCKCLGPTGARLNMTSAALPGHRSNTETQIISSLTGTCSSIQFFIGQWLTATIFLLRFLEPCQMSRQCTTPMSLYIPLPTRENYNVTTVNIINLTLKKHHVLYVASNFQKRVLVYNTSTYWTGPLSLGGDLCTLPELPHLYVEHLWCKWSPPSPWQQNFYLSPFCPGWQLTLFFWSHCPLPCTYSTVRKIPDCPCGHHLWIQISMIKM